MTTKAERNHKAALADMAVRLLTDEQFAMLRRQDLAK